VNRSHYEIKLNYHLKSKPDVLVYQAGDLVSEREASELLAERDRYIISHPVWFELPDKELLSVEA
jgi:hypothetical protein